MGIIGELFRQVVRRAWLIYLGGFPFLQYAGSYAELRYYFVSALYLLTRCIFLFHLSFFLTTSKPVVNSSHLGQVERGDIQKGHLFT